MPCPRRAKADAATLGIEILRYFVDHTGRPDVVAAGGQYRIGSEAIGNMSQNVVFGGFSYLDDAQWCVGVHNPEGDVTRDGWQDDSRTAAGSGNC